MPRVTGENCGSTAPWEPRPGSTPGRERIRRHDPRRSVVSDGRDDGGLDRDADRRASRARPARPTSSAGSTSSASRRSSGRPRGDHVVGPEARRPAPVRRPAHAHPRPALALIVWVHFAPPIVDSFRMSYRKLLRWNDEYPFAKFALATDERPILTSELPIALLSVRRAGFDDRAAPGDLRPAARGIGGLAVDRRQDPRPGRSRQPAGRRSSRDTRIGWGTCARS